MRAQENASFSNIAATTAAFALGGGKYAIDVHATFGGGNLQLQKLAGDGSTYVNVGASISADGLTTYDLPPGTYKIAVTTAMACYVNLNRVPGE
jgi:hypothetical protein